MRYYIPNYSQLYTSGSIKAKFLRHSGCEFILAEHVFLLWISGDDIKTPGIVVSALSAE